MLTRQLEATAEALVDSLADIGTALDEAPPEFDAAPGYAALASATRALSRLVDLLDGEQ